MQEIKLLMAYFLLNYEVQPIAVKTQPKWLGTFRMPDTKSTIRIRKKSPKVVA